MVSSESSVLWSPNVFKESQWEKQRINRVKTDLCDSLLPVFNFRQNVLKLAYIKKF